MSPHPLVQLRRRTSWRARCWYRFVQSDRKYRAGFRPELLRQGFFSYRAQLYPFSRYAPEWFVNDWAIEAHFAKINPPDVSAQLSNKLYFHLLLRALGLGDFSAPLIGVCRAGAFTSMSEYPSLRQALSAGCRVIAKPILGRAGAGVVLVDDPAKAPTDGVYLIEGVLKQHAYAAAVFPRSVNTIRVVTLRLADDKAPFIAGAAHRFGVASSAPVDNFSRGGVAAHVDLQTGELSTAYSGPGSGACRHYSRHPDTGVQIAGLTVPMWAQVKELALQLATRIAGLKLAGWDICVTPDGPRLIEGNGRCPHPELIQAHRPLLLDRNVREFCVQHQVISRAAAELLDQKENRGASPSHTALVRKIAPAHEELQSTT